jgi:hypothetical protein
MFNVNTARKGSGRKMTHVLLERKGSPTGLWFKQRPGK